MKKESGQDVNNPTYGFYKPQIINEAKELISVIFPAEIQKLTFIVPDDEEEVTILYNDDKLCHFGEMLVFNTTDSQIAKHISEVVIMLLSGGSAPAINYYEELV